MLGSFQNPFSGGPVGSDSLSLSSVDTEFPWILSLVLFLENTHCCI